VLRLQRLKSEAQAACTSDGAIACATASVVEQLAFLDQLLSGNIDSET
jgi:hypothetical protein